MLNEFCTLPHDTLQVRRVTTNGADFALPECDIVKVLPFDHDVAVERVGGVLFLHIDGRFRPLISLSEALCLPVDRVAHDCNQVVVVVRLGSQVFGLLVEHAALPTQAIVHPTINASPALAPFTEIVRLDDGRDVAVLNPPYLALSAQPGRAVDNLGLAA